MNILAIESGAGGAAVAALYSDGLSAAQPVAMRTLSEPRGLARDLIGAIDGAIEEAGWALDEVNLVAAGIGPGSWTSLRVVLSTAKTLAQARGWQLAGVPSFDAAAAATWRASQQENALPQEFLLLVTGRCRLGEVYGKIYAATAEYLSLVQPEWVGSPQMMADTLGVEAMARSVDGAFVLAGEASAEVGAILEAQNEPYLRVELPLETLVTEIGRAGQVALLNGNESDPLELQPLYLAPSAAERNLAPR